VLSYGKAKGRAAEAATQKSLAQGKGLRTSHHAWCGERGKEFLREKFDFGRERLAVSLVEGEKMRRPKTIWYRVGLALDPPLMAALDDIARRRHATRCFVMRDLMRIALGTMDGARRDDGHAPRTVHQEPEALEA